MTEWDASAYRRRSSLQAAMAAEVLPLLHLKGNERILDIGCGDGRITAEIASRVPRGSVLGVDSSGDMIRLASSHAETNLRFAEADARILSFHHEFDVVVSFNALHWLPDQAAPLRGIHKALKRGGYAQLRLVADGERKSLETVLEETRKSEKWTRYYSNFRDPYLHLTPDQYAKLAERNNFRVQHLHTVAKSWDFFTFENFFAFGQVTFVEWTHVLPDPQKSLFINEVLDRYRRVIPTVPTSPANSSAPHIFYFYQMDITLSPSPSL
jgi:trans-aconitate 2-methyltransferase